MPLRTHLRTVHLNREWTELQNMEKENFKRALSKEQEIFECLVDWIATSDQLLNVVENERFRKLLDTCCGEASRFSARKVKEAIEY